jgi:hypothetical protein
MANPPIDRAPVLAKINAAFVTRDPNYNSIRAGHSARLERLNKRMNALIRARTLLPVSQQISLEAQWLINYTDEWARVGDTLDRFEQSLGGGAQKLEQQPDGSWGSGAREFYRKLEPTVDFLQSDEVLKPKPGHELTLLPLTFMQPLQDPSFVTKRLDELRVSCIHQTGHNNRDEFGSMITSLAQLFFKAKLQRAFTQHPEAQFTVSAESFANFRDYLWQIQSSETGYWGPTYDFDDEVIEVQDLSFTFHVVKYYNDGKRKDLPNTSRIVTTTQTIETFVYPNGLKPPPPDFSDHNNYDLVTMFQQLWPIMSKEARADARQEIEVLLDWCLTTSLQDDGFAPSPDMSTVNSYYYGVQFLLVVGFWPQQAPFWTDGAPIPLPVNTPKPVELAKTLLDKFKADVNDNSDTAQTVMATLQAALGDPPAA